MTRPAASPRIAVTGVGVVCGLGSDQREVWQGLVEGRRGIGALELFDGSGCLSDRAGQVRRMGPFPGATARTGVPDNDPPPFSPAARGRLSRTDRLCLVAAHEAVAQAGIPTGLLSSFGVSLGSSTAGMLESEEYVARGTRSGFDRAPVSRLASLPTSAPTDAVARSLGAAGPRLSNMTACASSALSIGMAADLIRSGDAPGVIAGGGDALCRLTYSGFNALRLLDPHPCRPFDASRQGLTLGEGAGILVLEDYDAARARGAAILAELADYGVSCDAHHMTAPHPEGRGAAAAMAEALARAGVSAAEVAHVNAHGTGTSLNDAAEARALAGIFAPGTCDSSGPPITSTKGATGHLLGGAGGVEAVIVVLTLVHQAIPPTAGWSAADPGIRLDIVHEASRPADMETALSNSFGFGGSNVTLLFRKGTPAPSVRPGGAGR
jgi:3-oxoacyl-[acyl-carrier-protein] synthase II